MALTNEQAERIVAKYFKKPVRGAKPTKEQMENCLEALLERLEEGDGLSKYAAQEWATSIRQLLGKG